MQRRHVVVSCCSVTAALGFLDLIGWNTGSDMLRSMGPGLATMKPTTGIGLILSGLTLAAIDRRPGAWSPVVRLASLMVLLIGAVTVVEYRFGTETGLAGFWLADYAGSSSHPYPLRMSEITAWGFLAAGTGLVSSAFGGRWEVKFAAGLLLGGIALTALVGYLYDVRALYAVEPFTSIALNTSIGFAALTVAFVASDPGYGLGSLVGRDTTGGRITRVLLPLAVILPVALGWLRLEGGRRELYPTEFGTGLFAVASVVIVATIIVGFAFWLDRLETDRATMEQQLFQSQKLEAVGRLAAGVAHDFNNLLTVVVNAASLASEDLPTGHPAHDDLAAIRASGERASGLVRQLLTFGRGRVVQPRSVAIDDVVRNSEPLLRRLVPADVELVIELEEDRPGPVIVDPAQLEQVLVNLVVNACDAIGPGGRLTIETRSVTLDEGYAEHHADTRPGPHAMMVVTDNGSGMDQRTLSRIFEPFFTTKPQGKGTGLGLSTAYGIVRQSGGHIWVYSEVGHGTSFKVYLPVAEDSDQEQAPPAAVSTTRIGTCTILVVDDDAAVLRVVASILRRSGHTALSAGSPEEAVTIARDHPDRIDLVVTDAIMPGIGLNGLLAELEAIRPGVPMLCMSGYSEPTTRNAIAALGMGLLEKPFSPTDLMLAVDDALAGGEGGHGSAEVSRA